MIDVCARDGARSLKAIFYMNFACKTPVYIVGTCIYNLLHFFDVYVRELCANTKFYLIKHKSSLSRTVCSKTFLLRFLIITHDLLLRM